MSSTFKEFLLSLPMAERESFAIKCGTTYGHIRNIAYGLKSCDHSLALAIERETGGVVTVTELRPAFAESLRRAGYVKVDTEQQAA